MSKTITNIKFTYQDYFLLPEDKRYEIIEGELFMVPALGFSHQSVSKNLFRELDDYVRAKERGLVLYAPIDVVLSKETVVQPDILFISKERLSIITEKNIREAPDLIVEIISPATRKKDQILKRKLYAKFGVEEFWLVDPERKEIEVLSLEKGDYKRVDVYRRDEILCSPLLKDLRITVDKIF